MFVEQIQPPLCGDKLKRHLFMLKMFEFVNSKQLVYLPQFDHEWLKMDNARDDISDSIIYPFDTAKLH